MGEYEKFACKTCHTRITGFKYSVFLILHIINITYITVIYDQIKKENIF